ncbi:MAG: CPBP family intramembrane metalloprotease [Clostridiales bacterium]|nr:CPBP family intramembrane metalloprotease [Clostridiales bacterium]
MPKQQAWFGVLVLLVTLLLMLFVFAPIQYFFGLWGLAATELGLLAIALAAAKLLRYELRSVLRFRLPTPRQLLGTLVLWGGGLLCSLAATLVVLYLFPKGLAVSDQLESLFVSLPLPLSLLFVAVLPALCEEVLHRGVIYRSFDGFENRWLVVLFGGLLFGVFHLDPYRFLPTAILGACLTYLMTETENLLLPVLMHLVNNAYSVILTYTSASGAAEPITAESVGVGLMLLAFALPLLRWSASLLRPAGAPARPRRRLLTAALSLALFAGGSALFAQYAAPIFELSHTANPDGPLTPDRFAVEVPAPASYRLSASVREEGGRGEVTLELRSPQGEGVWRAQGADANLKGEIALQRGTYTLEISYDYPVGSAATVTVEVTLQ